MDPALSLPLTMIPAMYLSPFPAPAQMAGYANFSPDREFLSLVELSLSHFCLTAELFSASTKFLHKTQAAAQPLKK